MENSEIAKMCDLDSFCLSPLKIIFHSLQIFLRNKLIFSSIFALATIPLSSLILSLSLSTYPLRSKIYHLEAVALLAPTRLEARHVWLESREDAASLLRTRALYSIPCYLFSLIAAIAAVNTTVLAYSGKTPTLRSAVTAVRRNWKRPSVTTILVYAILLAFAPLPVIFTAFIPFRNSRFFILAIGSVVEIYLMAVLSMGLVTSIAEERFGWDAIKVGSGLIEGRRFCGWLLSGLFVLVSGMISWKLEALMDSPKSPSSTVELLSAAIFTSTKMTISVEDKMRMICLYGFVVLWSYVITAVFYCDGRIRHPLREIEDKDEGQGIPP